jgi:tripartite-type tricarboxylate transporter receptor subunit TctC
VALAPGIPTFAEIGLPALSFSGWYGLFAPRGTPKEVIDKLNAATVEALADPAVQSRLTDLGLGLFPPEQQTPDALGALMNAAAEQVGSYPGHTGHDGSLLSATPESPALGQ